MAGSGLAAKRATAVWVLPPEGLAVVITRGRGGQGRAITTDFSVAVTSGVAVVIAERLVLLRCP